MEDSRALGWDVPTVLHEIMAHPEVSLNAIRLLAEDVRSQVDRTQELATSRVEQRLARLLLRFAQSVERETARGVVVRLVL